MVKRITTGTLWREIRTDDKIVETPVNAWVVIYYIRNILK